MIDRHSALSFNLRPQLTDQEVEKVGLPVPDHDWEEDYALPTFAEDGRVSSSTIEPFSVRQMDMFGLFIPLSRLVFAYNS